MIFSPAPRHSSLFIYRNLESDTIRELPRNATDSRNFGTVSSALTLALKQIYSSAVDILGADLSIMQISDFILAFVEFHLGCTLGKNRKLNAAEVSCVQIQKTHICTHIISPFSLCYGAQAPTSGTGFSFQFQIMPIQLYKNSQPGTPPVSTASFR